MGVFLVALGLSSAITAIYTQQKFRCARNRSLPWAVNQVVSIRTTSTSVSGISVFPSADTDQIIFLGFLVVPVFTHSINTVYRNQTSSVFTRTPCFKQEFITQSVITNKRTTVPSFPYTVTVATVTTALNT
ncbi:hypothetical protein Tsp_07323 [Trichinella spiralis]|uniref:hypothetical protein n=1 Tax=Trichinella spiralis TaxID=6334 RepID=UPI0001EFC754|nr:hypothetical protein Tsp_07323 [Trichinella spiralis]